MSHVGRGFQQAFRARIAPPSPLYSATISPKNLTSHYATESSSRTTSPGGPQAQRNRRAVTVSNDDGQYSWSELSNAEKAARTTQQSFNFILVTAGVLGTVTISYLLYAELFAADSKTRQFNHAVDRIKKDPRCRELLGPSNKIVAYGEPTSNKWARSRPLAHTVELDRHGVTHLRMHFNVEGPENRGVVTVHMAKGKDDPELQYKLLSLHVPGHEIIYLENTDAKSPKRSIGKMFGVQWR